MAFTVRSAVARRFALRTALRLAAGITAVSTSAAFAVSCGPPPIEIPPLPSAAPPTFIAMLTPGVSIESLDGRWHIAGEDPAQPPFTSAWPDEIPRQASPQLLELSGHFLARGAQPCWVRVLGREKPLYGVLALLPVFSTATNPSARRTYRMDVPQANVQQALGGQISVLFEPYPYAYQTVATSAKGVSYVTDVAGEVASWVLWISDVPFVPGSPPPPPPRPAGAGVQIAVPVPPVATGSPEGGACKADPDCRSGLVCDRGHCVPLPPKAPPASH
jgi:hypothetical protein